MVIVNARIGVFVAIVVTDCSKVQFLALFLARYSLKGPLPRRTTHTKLRLVSRIAWIDLKVSGLTFSFERTHVASEVIFVDVQAW